jgi:iron(III) transport system ATP-binding protein
MDLLRAQNTTAILVTHDREEALVSADIVALMRGGKIIQQGTPEAVYSAPISLETAIGTGDALVLAAAKMADGNTTYLFNSTTAGAEVERGHIVIRPEEIKIDRDLSTATAVGLIEKIDYYGHDAMVSVDISGQKLRVRIPGPFDFVLGERVSVHHAGPVRFFADEIKM